MSQSSRGTETLMQTPGDTQEQCWQTGPHTSDTRRESVRFGHLYLGHHLP